MNERSTFGIPISTLEVGKQDDIIVINGAPRKKLMNCSNSRSLRKATTYLLPSQIWGLTYLENT
ncbi:hypothetical protein [Microbulbifer hydrolyticus]|uniref:Uncharacterized protein n=1 Tax=Microbulbifer hydrolyticus TaxID=48074 RepID=A0A6P1T7G2_9GAMM|nr:hypothetical protein [Microbulbifer hydrolyticus]MBB5211267.1 hypothetical protein [Microbulbifer hydrolyticus]QHQ37967.1 hypothetical protein GTQ55_02445 [Microbulbifer hydrolyticus]